MTTNPNTPGRSRQVRIALSRDMFPRLTDAEWAERGAILQRLADELDRHQRERERERGTHHPRFALPPAKPRSSRPGCIISYIDKVHARLQRDERRRQRHANGFI